MYFGGLGTLALSAVAVLSPTLWAADALAAAGAFLVCNQARCRSFGSGRLTPEREQQFFRLTQATCLAGIGTLAALLLCTVAMAR
jgi:hypothetical protein